VAIFTEFSDHVHLSHLMISWYKIYGLKLSY